MNTNFENINLYIHERYKLFCLRWIKKQVTDTYFRYCVWRRNRFFYGTLWPQLVAGITSLIVSVLTVVVLMNLGLR